MTMTTIKRTFGGVKFWNEERGFGFLRPLIENYDGTYQIDASELDVFCHATRLKQTGLEALTQDDIVSYEISKSARTGKLEASDVRIEAAK
jgi:cold shock CspA family protein